MKPPTTDIFLPPGVQQSLFKKFGDVPRRADPSIAKQIDALWQRRNTAADAELATIDREMERLARHVLLPIVKLAETRFGARRKITRDEMAALLAEYSRIHPGMLGNGYVPDTMPRHKVPSHQMSEAEWQAVLDAQPASYHDRAARAWAQMVGGITVISVGGILRDGGTRYDQPGSMNPSQIAELSFYSDAGRGETIEYLRRHCAKLLLVREESVLAPPEPPKPLPQHRELHAKWQRARELMNARIAREEEIFQSTGNDDGLPRSEEERAMAVFLHFEVWPEDPAEIEEAITRNAARNERLTRA